MAINKELIFSELTAKNINSVHIGFSGGNDEGGADDMVIRRNNGDEEKSDFWRNLSTIIPSDIVEKLTEPIYDKWGGFAGDFQVYGTLIWDVEKKDVYFQGQESTYAPFEEKL